MRVAGKVALVHRVMYERMRGPIPRGLELDHICRVRRCVNPFHLRAVTHKENCLESRVRSPFKLNADKIKCHRGHPFTEENTYIYKDGRRDCRVCMRLRARSTKRQVWERQYNRSTAGRTRSLLSHYRHKEARNAYSREYMKQRRLKVWEVLK